MNSVVLSLYTSMFHLFLSVMHFYSLEIPVQPVYPLIFNTQTNEVYPTWENTPEDGGPYAVACPATKGKEMKLNREYSLDHKSTFVRHAVKEKIPKLEGKRCLKRYRLSVVAHSVTDTERIIEFGYEVYFDESEVQIKFQESIYEKFRSISDVDLDSIPKLDQNTVKMATGPIMVEEIQEGKGNDNKIQKNIYMRFVWIPRITVKFDFSRVSVKSLTYFLDRKIDGSKLKLKCDDYLLDTDLLGFTMSDHHYQLQHQEHMLSPSRVKLPELKDGRCKSSYDCIKKYNFLSPYQFQNSLWTSISCADFTSIPLWYETAEDVLNYLEKFFIALAQIASNKLKITSGVHNTLAFPPIRGDEMVQIHLDIARNKYPVPKIIYNIVAYQSHHNCELDKHSCWFDILIVIHNQPQVSQDDIICEDKCEKLGWDSIQYLSTTDKNPNEKSSFVYCCELNPKLREELDYTNDIHRRENLNLKQFPYYYDEISNKINRKDIREEIGKNMKELFV